MDNNARITLALESIAVNLQKQQELSEKLLGQMDLYFRVIEKVGERVDKNWPLIEQAIDTALDNLEKELTKAAVEEGVPQQNENELQN